MIVNYLSSTSTPPDLFVVFVRTTKPENVVRLILINFLHPPLLPLPVNRTKASVIYSWPKRSSSELCRVGWCVILEKTRTGALLLELN